MVTAVRTNPNESDLKALADLLRSGPTMVLSGAGVSTESGIPDYRGPGAAARSGSPITYQEFVRSERSRQRYWARSFVGWSLMRKRLPNAGHRALAELEREGLVSALVTQNVDGLHQAAGSVNVIELHGNLAEVRCLRCGTRERRSSLQARLDAANPNLAGALARMAPDGDAEVADAQVEEFTAVDCLVCGGTLKPDVVFFGENVPKPRLEAAWAELEAADNLLVVGSSLTVMSGYRFVKAAVAAAKPVAIVNDGPTRGDDDASLRLSGRLGVILPALLPILGVS